MKKLHLICIVIISFTCLIIGGCIADSPKEVLSIYIAKLPNRVDYLMGEEISYSGLSVRLNYTNGENEKIDFNDLIFSNPDLNSQGDKTVIIKYIKNDIEYSTNFSINVGMLSLQINNDGTTYKISGIGTYRGNELIVPAMFNNKKITKIDNYAFSDSNISKITLNDNITSIGDHAFKGSKLKSIFIPQSINYIGNSALNISSLSDIQVSKNNMFYASFDGVLFNKDLTTLIKYPQNKSAGNFVSYYTNNRDYAIPNTVTHIENGAFFNCVNLYKVFIPINVETIDGFGFSSGLERNTNLRIYCESKSMPSGWVRKTMNSSQGWNNGWNSDDVPVIWDVKEFCENSEYVYVLHNNETVSIVKSIIDSKIVNVNSIAGRNITTILDHAFEDKMYLEQVFLSNSVVKICEYAFVGCQKIKEVHMSDNLVFIGNSAFNYCKNLVFIELSKNMEHIGALAFSDCSSLTQIVIPSSVKKIDNWAFYNCHLLTIFCEVGKRPDTWDYEWAWSLENFWYSENKPNIDGKYWRYVDGEPAIWA